MSNTAYVSFPSSNSLLGRLWAAVDRLLMAYAQATIRNGDIPRYNV
jgi:hypothetical protein